jgi:tetratricopeptide (TPR) repeat protein
VCARKCEKHYAMRVVSFAAAISLGLCASQPVQAQESQLDALRAAARAAPRDPLAALALGTALRRADRLPAALAELRRGIAIAGLPETLRLLEWEVVRVEGDRHDFLQTMASCKPLKASVDAHACAAFAHLVRQRATEALEETAIALAKDPHSYEAKVAEGRAYELELDMARAETSLREAIADHGDRAEAHEVLGRVLLKEGRRDVAAGELRQAIALDPAGPDALYELAGVIPPGDESVRLLEGATHERLTFMEAWLALGSQQLAAGRLGEAKKAAEAAVKIDSHSAGAYVLAGKVALAEGRTDDAIAAGQNALANMANSAAAKLLVADGNARKGEIDAALEAYQAAWGLDHADPTPLVHASEACHARGRDTTARAFGVRATQEFPRWAPGWVALGDALAAQAEVAAARDAYRKALTLDGPVDIEAVKRKLGALH